MIVISKGAAITQTGFTGFMDRIAEYLHGRDYELDSTLDMDLWDYCVIVIDPLAKTLQAYKDFSDIPPNPENPPVLFEWDYWVEEMVEMIPDVMHAIQLDEERVDVWDLDYPGTLSHLQLVVAHYRERLNVELTTLSVMQDKYPELTKAIVDEILEQTSGNANPLNRLVVHAHDNPNNYYIAMMV